MRRSLSQVENLVAYVFAAARNEAARFATKRAHIGTVESLDTVPPEFCQATPGDDEGREAAEWVASALDYKTDVGIAPPGYDAKAEKK